MYVEVCVSGFGIFKGMCLNGLVLFKYVIEYRVES